MLYLATRLRSSLVSESPKAPRTIFRRLRKSQAMLRQCISYHCQLRYLWVSADVPSATGLFRFPRNGSHSIHSCSHAFATYFLQRHASYVRWSLSRPRRHQPSSAGFTSNRKCRDSGRQTGHQALFHSRGHSSLATQVLVTDVTAAALASQAFSFLRRILHACSCTLSFMRLSPSALY